MNVSIPDEMIKKCIGMYAIKTNGNECMCMRDRENVIKIQTGRKLNDEQMKDIFIIAYCMARTGKTLKDMGEIKFEGD